MSVDQQWSGSVSDNTNTGRKKLGLVLSFSITLYRIMSFPIKIPNTPTVENQFESISIQFVCKHGIDTESIQFVCINGVDTGHMFE